MPLQTITCTFKFELMPDKDQRAALSLNAGCRRFAYNKMLELLNERKEADEHIPNYSEMSHILTGWKKEPDTAFLREAIAQSLQQGIYDLSVAVKNYFRKPDDPAKKGWPRFHEKNVHDGFRLPQPKSSDVDEINGRVNIPKIGWIRYRQSRLMRMKECDGREVEGKLLQIRINKDVDKWYVGFVMEFHLEQPDPNELEIAIDIGIVHAVTTNEGHFFDLDVDRIRELEEKIQKNQRKLSLNANSRKKLVALGKTAPIDKHKPSRTRRELQEKIQKLHRKIRNIRADFRKKLAHTLAQEYGCVYAEDLRVRNLTASAKGTVENPGKNVKQKSGLNRAILRIGWYGIREEIEWAQRKTGGRLIVVDPKNTSRTCPGCGHVSAENRRSQALFKCVKCDYTKNADVVGALNVLRKGRTKKAEEVTLPVLPSAHIQKKRIARVVNGFRGGVCEAPLGAVISGNHPMSVPQGAG